MNQESLREYCLSLPHTTEKVQWVVDLLFCVGGKMFLVMPMEAGHGLVMSFKCTEERFHELLEREGVRPAPYLARAKWVALERFDTLPPDELRQCVREAYETVLAKLPRKQREALAAKPKAHGRSKTAGRR